MTAPDTPEEQVVADASRRRFLGTAGVTTAGAVVAPMVANRAVAAQPAGPVAAGAPIANKLEDLARETSIDAGQALTTNQGVKIADHQNTLKAGLRGPALLEDQLFREKLTAFDHERIPERVVHARGAAAHGVFESYASLSQLTKASFLASAGKKTPVFVRFSTVAGSKGSADTARDVRGFAVKFYTDEGNYDLVGNNIPVFFIQDAIKFPDLIHAAKPEADREIPQASTAHDTFWDFISLMPESTHMVMWIMSDRAIPRAYQMMEGFGVHTFRMINAQGTSRFVKFHWKPLKGVHGLAWDEAQKLAGKDPDFHRRDLADAIVAKDFPEWELGVQVVEEADATRFGFDLLDATKLIPEELVPVRPIGKMTLNRNPDNYFAETEQVAFHTGNLVPGIDVTDDPLLQGRMFSYVDTQLTRLGGPNFHEIPINRPLCPFHNLQRDGFHRQTIAKGRVNYEPSSIDVPPIQEVPPSRGGFASYPEPISGNKVRHRSETFADHYSQATLFWQSQTKPEQQHIVEALQFELGKVSVPAVRLRMLSNLVNVDRDLAARVAAVLGVPVPPASPRVGNRKYAPSPALSMIARGNPKSIVGRKIAFLAADGVDEAGLQAVKAELTKSGAVVKVLAPHLGNLRGANGGAVKVDDLIVTMPSVVFDAVFVPGGDASVKALKASGDAVHFVREAFKHAKALAALAGASDLLSFAGIPAAAGATVPGVSTSLDTNALVRKFIADIGVHRHWERAQKDSIAA
ncbi:catalase [Aquabacterium soli]|uniref:Catalase n=2 Tax=Aquabacterium soli TaxID=2493092 RepID=A0A3R8SBZ1_9BURK|nr:catalase [Aquabacterium soli]RRS06055.1 catalase [Aquabacterium soli]